MEGDRKYPVSNYPVTNYPVSNYPVSDYPVTNYPGYPGYPVSPNRANFAARFFNQMHRWFNILGRFWWVILLGAASAVAVEMYRLRHLPPSFVSTGRMIVASKMSVPNASAYSEEIGNFLGTQTALMQSEVVVNRATLRLRNEKPNLAPSKVDLNVTVSPKTTLFSLRAIGADPDYTAAFLQMAMEEYVALKKEMVRDITTAAKTGLNQAMARLTTDLEAAKKELVDYGANNKEVFLQNDQGNSAGDYLASLTRQLANLKSELQLLKTLTLDENVERLVGLQQTVDRGGLAANANNAAGQSPAATAPTSIGLTQPNQLPKSVQATTPGKPGQPAARNETPESSAVMVGSENEYLKAKQQILLMKAQQNDLGKFLRPKHPKIIALADEIDRMEQLLEIYRGQTKEQLQGRQHTLEVQIENLEQDIKVWEGKTVTLSQKMTDYRAIKEKITRLQNISDSLFAAENNVNVGGQISPEGVTILQPATLAYLEPPAVAQHVIIAAALGLIAALAILLFVDRLDDRPNSLTEIVEHFDEAVLGQIPRVRVKNKADGVPILQEDDKRHAFREAYRNLRSSLIALGTSPQDHPRLILVTSAIPGDGKSLTVANLAITIAHAGLKVLLIDADMRRGVLHKRFNIGSTPGLAEVLNEQSPWSAAVVQGPVPTLHLLPRGASPKTPGELFMKPIREQFFKEAIAKYDYVLVDSPPVMAADDVSNLAPHVDGVLMVLRANYTSSRVARATLDLLYARKGHILGLVFNGVRPSGEDYYYYKYKKYYT